ncbi:MAG TPA: glycosyltransferase family 39 protein [Gemmatimonadales bacterium]|nr:glycosyltransferase family 39 protein [Gemmatimonadales bacterium]
MKLPGATWLVWLVIALAGIALALNGYVAAVMSQTYDEPVHLAYGRQILHGQPDRGRSFDSQMPISALNALPTVLAERLKQQHALPRFAAWLEAWQLTRVASVIALLLLDLVIIRWAYALYGRPAAIAAAVLALFSPNLIAHGTLATTDVYFALGVLLSLYCVRRFLLRPTVGTALIAAAALALAQVTKPFAIYLYPLVFVFVGLAAVYPSRTAPKLSRRAAVWFVFAGVACFVVVINLVYQFDRTFEPLRSYTFYSAPLVRLQEIVARTPVLWRTPVPFPHPFLQGLDLTKANEANGASYGSIYLLGTLRDARDPLFHGFKSYYAVAYLFKEAIPLQVLLVLGLLWVVAHRRLPELVRGEGLLLAAAAALGVWLSFFDKAQIGIRHLLPALAAAVVIASAPFADWPAFRRRRKVALGLFGVWLCVSTLSYYPHLIPYMNELVPDRRFGYKILADSNLDWGQNERWVRRFLAENPDVVLDPGEPICGRVLMSANYLVGVEPRFRGRPSWALRYTPVGHVAYAHLLFRIPGGGDTRNRREPCIPALPVSASAASPRAVPLATPAGPGTP